GSERRHTCHISCYCNHCQVVYSPYLGTMPTTGHAAARKRVSPERLAVWRSFLRAHSEVVQTLERELVEERDLPLTWYDVLLNLGEAPRGACRSGTRADTVLSTP